MECGDDVVAIEAARKVAALPQVAGAAVSAVADRSEPSAEADPARRVGFWAFVGHSGGPGNRAGPFGRSFGEQMGLQSSKIKRMKVATGKVVDGRVVLEGEPLTEGSVVTVLAQEDDETFDVTPEEEKALLRAMTEAERGQVVSWQELRERLRRFE